MILPQGAESIRKAAALLREGKLVAFPSETVYGLGGDATNDQAVAAIFAAKDRPRFNPLIIHVLDIEKAGAYADLTPEAYQLARHFWPGPLTLILKRKDSSPISRLASAGLDTIALRAPAHPVARALLEESALPLAGPSANPSGRISPTLASHVEEAFPHLAILEGGATSIGLESSVVYLSDRGASLLRVGPILAEDLAPYVHLIPMEAKEIRSPGQTLRHYAPSKPLRMNVSDLRPEETLLAFGPGPFPGPVAYNLSPSGDLTEAASRLFAMLHELDHRAEVRAIAVMSIPEVGLGLAINDRLRRGAA